MRSLVFISAGGGASKNGIIELQGAHKEAVKKVLLEMGYPEDSIDL